MTAEKPREEVVQVSKATLRRLLERVDELIQVCRQEVGKG
jgi:hypothetical protein